MRMSSPSFPHVSLPVFTTLLMDPCTNFTNGGWDNEDWQHPLSLYRCLKLSRLNTVLERKCTNRNTFDWTTCPISVTRLGEAGTLFLFNVYKMFSVSVFPPSCLKPSDIKDIVNRLYCGYVFTVLMRPLFLLFIARTELYVSVHVVFRTIQSLIIKSKHFNLPAIAIAVRLYNIEQIYQMPYRITKRIKNFFLDC